MTAISKIKKINNLGIYLDYTWPLEPPKLAFDRINLLYGYNGSGKTMLSNVMSLFSEDLDEQVQKRIAQNMASDTYKDVSVEMLCDEKIVKYPKDRLKIFVFNSAFVAKHVYDGRQENVSSFKNTVVTKEQLSHPAVQKLEAEIKNQTTRRETVEGYKKELTGLAEEIKEDLSEKWKEIKGRQRPNLDIDTLPDNAPEKSEEDFEKALDDQVCKSSISKDQKKLEDDINTLSKISKPNLTLPNMLKGILKKSISAGARKKVQRKIEAFINHKLKHTTLQNWFEDGSSLLEDNKEAQTCPLCDSTVHNIDEIIASYHAFFNVDLEDLKGEIVEAINSIELVLKDSSSRKDQIGELKIIQERYGYQNLASVDENAAIKRLKSQTIKSKLEKVKELFVKKRDSISYSPLQDDLNAVDELVNTFEEFQKDIAKIIGFKDRIQKKMNDETYDDKIAKDITKNLFYKKFDIQGKEKAKKWFDKDQTREKELKIGIKKNTHGIEFYKDLKKLLEDIEKIIKTKETDKASELGKIEKESEYVNEYLKMLCVRNFNIIKGDDGELTICYKDGKLKKGIEYSLSEGEKNSLAFAYFLSKYRYEVIDNKDEKPEDYILVIDDPVSSLDENRLISTALLIQKLLPTVDKENQNDNTPKWKGTKQIFIFSHNLIFLKFMSNIIEYDANKGRADFYLDKGKLSFLPDALQNYQTSYFYKLNKVMAFVDGKQSVTYEIVKDYLPNYIRTVLEAFISFKFARLKGRDKHKPAMLDHLIKHLDDHAYKFEGFEASGSVKYKDTLKSTLQQIKAKVNPETHGTVQDVTHIEYLPESELKEAAEQTLNVIEFLDQIHFEATRSKVSSCDLIKKKG